MTGLSRDYAHLITIASSHRGLRLLLRRAHSVAHNHTGFVGSIFLTRGRVFRQTNVTSAGSGYRKDFLAQAVSESMMPFACVDKRFSCCRVGS